MGVIYSHMMSKFYMPVTNTEKALSSLQNFIKKHPYYAWDAQEVLNAKNIKDCFWSLGFVLESDSQGNVINIRFGGDKIPEDGPHTVSALFNCIAKYVKKGSRVAIMDEFYTLHEYTFYDTYTSYSYSNHAQYDGLIKEGYYKLYEEPKNIESAIKYFIYASQEEPEYKMAWFMLSITSGIKFGKLVTNGIKLQMLFLNILIHLRD
jgi:hypothetical protein